jgi:DNA gyrase subunit A
VGALIVDAGDELYAITSSGGVIRTSAEQVRKAGRQTKGVRLMNLGDSATLVGIARSAEDSADAESAEAEESTEAPQAADGEQPAGDSDES